MPCNYSAIAQVVDPSHRGPFVHPTIVTQGGRWTESRNDFSTQLSKMAVREAIDLFLASHQSALRILEDPRTTAHLTHLTNSIKRNPPKRIIIGGAGSSGRVAVILSHLYGEELKKMGIEIVPWMVGGARAVKQTVENAEDNPNSLAEFLQSSHKAPLNSEDLVIGISCGASAPSVAGAIQLAHDSGARTSLLANNPFSMAPAKGVPELPGGMKEVLKLIHESDRFFPLPALYGAEILTGSSRLNGGSTTWVALETFFDGFLSNQYPLNTIRSKHQSLFRDLKLTWDKNVDTLETAVFALSEALREPTAEIELVGDESCGRVCVLDASELPPTFGVEVGWIKAFLPGGWNRILGDFFSEKEVSELERESPSDSSTFADKLTAPGFQLRITQPNRPTNKFEFECKNPLLAKMLTNCLTTLAFAKAGYVQGNIMTNMVPSNIKLIQRAIGIICDIVTGTDETQAELALAKAILGSDAQGPFDHSILAKAACRGCLPLAITIAQGR